MALPVLAISGALFLSFFFGSQVQILDPSIPHFINPGGIFGTAVATMGMLMSCAYILAMDTFGLSLQRWWHNRNGWRGRVCT